MIHPDKLPNIRLPKKNDSLRFLRENGLNVETILDVGVQHETVELKSNFPLLKHFLFEPVEEYYNLIEENYRNYNYELFTGALSDKNGESLLTISRKDSDTITHSSLYGASDGEKAETRVIKTITLDNFFEGQRLP